MKKLLPYAAQFKPQIAIAFTALALHNLMNAVSLTLVIPFLEILFSNAAHALPAEAIDWFSVASVKAHAYGRLSLLMALYGKMQTLGFFCAFIGGAIFLKSAFRYLSAYHISRVEQGLMFNLRNRLFQHLTRLPLSFFGRNKKGRLINLLVADVQIVQEAVVGTLGNLLSDPMTMLVFLAAMLLISWKLTLFTLLVLPLTGLVISRIARSLKKRANAGQARFDDLLALIDEFVGGIRIVKAFVAEDALTQKYQNLNGQYAGLMTSFRRRAELASPITEFLSILVVLSVILYGGSLILNGEGELKASEFIGFIALFSQFIAPIKTLTAAIARVQKALVSYARIDEVLQEPIPATESDAGRKIEGFEREIEFRNVTFRYEPTGKEVLKNISFTLKKGQTVALVGASGGGKSTIADLLCRFHDPVSGQILIDGIDLREFSVRSLRRLYGVVAQDGTLFNDTLAANVAFGQDLKPEDAEQRRRIAAALQTAYADGFVQELPQGVFTEIGERGTKLSGGQRQRIAIARAVYHRPPILILDEATSALDNRSELAVQQALEKIMENRTSLVIAHRLGTVAKADLILAIEEGEIVERGTHEQLLQQNGYYRKLYNEGLRS